MAKKTVRPDTPAAASPVSSRRRAPTNGRRTTTRRTAAPGDGADALPNAPAEVADRAADMRTAGDIQIAVRRAPSPEEIAEAAYQRYLERGGEHGRDFDDWLEAERSLRER